MSNCVEIILETCGRNNNNAGPRCPPGCVPAPPPPQPPRYNCQPRNQHQAISPRIDLIINEQLRKIHEGQQRQIQQYHHQQQYQQQYNNCQPQQHQQLQRTQSDSGFAQSSSVTASVNQLPPAIKEVLAVADRIVPEAGKVTYINVSSCNQSCQEPTPDPCSPPPDPCGPPSPPPCSPPPQPCLPPPQPQQCRSSSPYEVLPIKYVNPCDPCDPCNQQRQHQHHPQPQQQQQPCRTMTIEIEICQPPPQPQCQPRRC